ncbi:MAG: hypothetical protein RR620_10435 [Clostridium sp.]
MNAYIQLKSGNFIEIQKLKSITYPHSSTGAIQVIEKFDNFYLKNLLLTFVGENSILTIDSKSIEFIKFDT